MNHLKWMGHSATIFDIQRNLRDDQQSYLLRNLLVDIPMGQEATIVVPDIKGSSLLESVLAFIYVGETTTTNLSEFLEAINTLGIKSTISFCSSATLSGAVPTTTVPLKSLSNIQIAHEELIEHQENITAEKIETQNVIQDEREMEFLDVYNEAQHSKITYSIEHMLEYILTENSDTFTLTQNNKLENASNASDSEKLVEMEDTNEGQIIEEYGSSTCSASENASNASDSEKLVEVEDTNDEGQIIEEYGSSTCSAHSIIEISANPTPITSTPRSTATTTSLQQHQQQQQIIPPPIIQIKTTPKLKTFKLKTTNEQVHQQQNHHHHTLDPTADHTYATLNTTPSGGATLDALYNAVKAVIKEGMSSHKAAQKYNLSKGVLWRRVRKHPQYMKTSEKPVLTAAYERLKGGDSVTNISRELDIPISTLHKHKVRLAQQGRLPDYVNSKIEFRDKLTKALHACAHEGMSIAHAAKLFDIPRSTLHGHKVRLPDYVNSKIEFRDKLTKALHACAHEGMSIAHAAKLFDIPISTLRHKVRLAQQAARTRTFAGNPRKNRPIG